MLYFCRDYINLTSITIPSSVKSFGDGCFSSCSSLTSIAIPSSVTDLGLDSFYGCTNLESVIFEGKCPENTIRYSDIPSTCILYVPKEYLQDYKDALGDIYPYIYAYSSTNINQAKTRGIVATSHDASSPSRASTITRKSVSIPLTASRLARPRRLMAWLRKSFPPLPL